jgi:hypothetical protein
MINSGMAIRSALHGLTAVMGAATVVYSFMAYLDPTVFMPLLNVFAFCQ